MSSAPPTSTDAPLTGAALKAQKKAEKAAKRAAIISQRPGGGQGPPQAGGQAQVPVGKGKKDGPEATPKKGAQGHKRVGSNVRDVKVLQDQSKRKVAVSEPAKPKAEDKTVELLRHLYRKRATTVAGWKDIHPAVQHLGQQMRTYVVCGSTARLVAMMQCWQRVSSIAQFLRRHEF